jgi:hypothetical protein
MRSLAPPLALLLASLATSDALAQTGSTRLPPKSPAAEQPWDPAVSFLAPYGLQNFSQQHVDALRTFLLAEREYEAGRYVRASNLLGALWAQYPTGDPSWAALPTQPFGINIGSPPCYYALRMLTDMAAWRVHDPSQGPAPRTARLSVLLVGRTAGVEPQNATDIAQGGGVPVQHALDPRVAGGEHFAVTESLALFEEYVLAMTGGLLALETHVVPLPDVTLSVHAGVLPGGTYYAGLTDASELWFHLSDALMAATDWWWIVYPSHVPEQHPDFHGAEFVTGGMGTGPDSVSPCFIVDDRWLVRKPPHLGSGEYSDVERRAYLPQWLQHEFFHHLFRAYPQFGLEATSHQWFDPANWPPDFLGRYEADYYHEALYRRLTTATPPLHVGLRYATAGAPWSQITLAQLLGTYRREPVQNPWHVGNIQLGPQLEWRNTAGVEWSLTDDIANGRLLTAPDCPYYGQWNGRKFDIVLERDANGDLTSTVRGFGFVGELYLLQ